MFLRFGAAAMARSRVADLLNYGGIVVVDIQPWSLVDELVVAAGGRDQQLVEFISNVGPARVADVLADEVQRRCDPPVGVGEVAVGLSLRFGDKGFRYLVSFKGGQTQVGPGDATDVLAEIGYSLTDLTRLLYPARAGYESTSRDVRIIAWPWTTPNGDITEEKLDEMLRRAEVTREQLSMRRQEHFSLLQRVVESVVSACSSEGPSLSGLATLYGSDKWGTIHWYTPHYQAHFAGLRYDPVRVLEIGIGGYNHESLGGESLYMWQRFFPRGLIYGLDIVAKPNVVGPRIRTIKGDQNDPAFLHELGEVAGPFDIVIDDGSHINEHVRTSFETLFSYVRPGGWYVIEDLHTAYWPAFGGDAVPGAPHTTIGLLKNLLDRLHQEEFLDTQDERMLRPTHPSEIFVHHNLALLRKGMNHEPGIPGWIKRRAGGSIVRSSDDGSVR